MLNPRPVPFPRLVVKKGSKTCGSTSAGNPASRVNDPDLHFFALRQSVGENGNSPALRGRLRGIQQQVHQHLRKLIRIRADHRQVLRHQILHMDFVEHRLMFKKVQRVGDQAVEIQLLRMSGAGRA